MKKRLDSIMDVGRKRGGVIIACLAVIAVLGTGLILAINTNNNNASPDTVIPDEAEKAGIAANYRELLSETNNLVLYRNYANKYMLDSAVGIFKEMYPDMVR